MGGSQSNDYTSRAPASSGDQQQSTINLSDYTYDAMENWDNDKIKKRYGKLSLLHPIIQYTLKSREVINYEPGIVCIKYWYGPRAIYQFAGDDKIRDAANLECLGNHWVYDFFDKETGEYLSDSWETAKAKQLARLQKIEQEKEQKRREEEQRRQEEARKAQEEQRRQEEARRVQEQQRKQEEARRAQEEQRQQEEARRAQEEQLCQEEARRVQEEQQRCQEEARRAQEQQRQQDEARKAQEEQQQETNRVQEEQQRQEEAGSAQEEQLRAQEQVGVLQEQQQATGDQQQVQSQSQAQDANNNETSLGQEAEQLLLEAIKIYEEGRLSEAAGRIRSALDFYVKSSSKLNEAASKKIVDNILNSYLKVITSMLRNEAYDEAKDVLESMQTFFPRHEDQFRVLREAIDKQEWSADYLKEKLLSEELYREIIGHL